MVNRPARRKFTVQLSSKSVAESRTIAIEKLMQIWEQVHIPCAEKRSVVVKFNSLLEQYKLLKKSKGRTTDAQKRNEKQFQMKIQGIFDIAHKNAELMMKVQADQDFLADQRGDRKMSMGGIDKKTMSLNENEKSWKKLSHPMKILRLSSCRNRSVLHRYPKTVLIPDHP